MYERFLIRFNLQNDANDEVKREYMDEFQKIQDARVYQLKNAFANEIRLLQGKRVLFLGDSITSDNLGYRVTVTQAAELCSTDGSVSGATTTSLFHLAKANIEKDKYDLISIMLGANDSVMMIEKRQNQVSPDEFVANMDKILGWAKESETPVLLLPITRVQEKWFEKSFLAHKKSQSNQTIEEYNYRLKQLADKHEIFIMEHLWQTDDLFFEEDGIHLSILGQEKLSEAWLHAASNLMKRGKI